MQSTFSLGISERKRVELQRSSSDSNFIRNQTRTLWNHVCSDNWKDLPVATIWVPPYIEIILWPQTFVPVTSSTFCMFQLLLAPLETNFPMLCVVPQKHHFLVNNVFKILNFNYSKHPYCRPMNIKVAHGLVTLSSIVNVDDDAGHIPTSSGELAAQRTKFVTNPLRPERPKWNDILSYRGRTRNKRATTSDSIWICQSNSPNDDKTKCKWCIHSLIWGRAIVTESMSPKYCINITSEAAPVHSTLYKEVSKARDVQRVSVALVLE